MSSFYRRQQRSRLIRFRLSFSFFYDRKKEQLLLRATRVDRDKWASNANKRKWRLSAGSPTDKVGDFVNIWKIWYKVLKSCIGCVDVVEIPGKSCNSHCLPPQPLTNEKFATRDSIVVSSFLLRRSRSNALTPILFPSFDHRLIFFFVDRRNVESGTWKWLPLTCTNGDAWIRWATSCYGD